MNESTNTTGAPNSGDAERGADRSDVWMRVLRAALAIPGARIDRDSFLRAQLAPYYREDLLSKAIASSPAQAGLSPEEMDKVADACISRHISLATGGSILAGLPGGWWMAGTVPADLAQFYYNALQLAQKLAYIYGWPELTGEGTQLDDETLLRMTLFLGVALGASGATAGVTRLAEALARETTKRLPKAALTKYAVFNLSKQVAKWIGVKLTKQSFSRWVAKAVPVLGGFVSGTVTFFSFRPMAKRLKKHLRQLPIADPGHYRDDLGCNATTDRAA